MNNKLDSKKEKKKKRYSEFIQVFLPTKLIEEIESTVLKISRDYRSGNNYIYCLALIYFKQITEFQNKELFVSLGSAYWKKIFGNNYHQKIIAPLIQEGIIQFIDSGYRNIKNEESQNEEKGTVAIKYRINPNLLNDEFAVIDYLKQSRIDSKAKNNKSRIPINATELLQVSIDEMVVEWIEDNAQRICKEFLNQEYVETLPNALIIEYHELLDNGSYNSNFKTIKTLKKYAYDHGKEFFFFKNSFYVAELEQFMKAKEVGILYHYKCEVAKVGKIELIDNRSQTNLRLTNYLVNFPSKLLRFIHLKDESVVQFDLRTSQLLLFANILNVYTSINGKSTLLNQFKKTKTIKYLQRLFQVLEMYKFSMPAFSIEISDAMPLKAPINGIQRFIKDVLFNDFYEVLQKKLGLPSRNIAKLLVLKMLFKRTNRPDVLLKQMNDYYPEIMAIISEFKEISDKQDKRDDEDSDDNNFAVFLQCVEAEIFVDKILKPLRQQGIPCFTRHDSVVVANTYQKAVEDQIKKVFSELGFKLNLKYEGFSEVDEYVDNEMKKEITERLQEIGIKDDYSQDIDIQMLEEIAAEFALNQVQQEAIAQDIIDIQSGLHRFSNETNNLMKKIIQGNEY